MIGTKPKGYIAPGNPDEVMNMSISLPNDIGSDSKSSVKNNFGEFNSFKSKLDKNSGEGKQRMAGEYLSEFIDNNKSNESNKSNEGYKSNVMGVLGGQSGSIDYRNGVRNKSKSNTSAPATASTPATPAKSASNDAGMAKYQAALDAQYKENQAIIANYNGKNGSNSTASGAEYNADLMSGINYQRAKRQNEKIDANKKSQASLAAGNDHGSGEWKAPQSKEYYDYLKTYSGPKSYDATIGKGQEAYDTYDKWVKDSRHYKKAWEGIDYKKVNDRAVYGLP
jgi:hypothetical protein